MIDPTQMPPEEGMPVEEMPEDGIQERMPVEESVIPDNEQESEAVEGELTDQLGEVELGPGQQAQLDAYMDNATLAVFSEKTQPGILQMLQADKNKVKAVATTAFNVHTQLESGLQQTGEKMTEITMCLGAAHLVSELVVLAKAAKLYELTPEERLEAFRHSVMKYFETGLKNGTIDPVELQKTIEHLMSREQKEYGLQQMEKSGISKTAPPSGYGMKGQQRGILGGAA